MAENSQTAHLPLPPALKLLRSLYPVIESLTPGLAKIICARFFLRPFRFGRPAPEQEIAQSASTSQITINGEQIACYHWGAANQPYILCVHGWSGRATQFFALIKTLLDNGYSVLAFDGPAHGKSTGRETNLVEFAQCIDALIKLNGSPACLIGHSLGGVACMYYQKHYNSSIPQITINSPVLPQEIFENYAFRLNANPQKVARWLSEYTMKKLGIAFEQISGNVLAEDFPEVPFLVCTDENDREVSPANAQLLQQKIPQAQLFVSQKQGHVRILKYEPLLHAVIIFIQENTKQ
ncbi:alpha/beta fold hydrolase [bacterium]|nr:alpha/beta fold hydrolase [bacterium]